MTTKEIMTELEKHGDEKIKKMWLKHGVKEPFFGVKIEYLKTIVKKVKKDQRLAGELFASGNADAMYLAGLIAEDEKFSKKELNGWVAKALSNNISEYTVPWVTAGNPQGYELALEWIDSPKAHIAAAGWATLGGWVSLKPDAMLDLTGLRGLLARAAKSIHTAPNRVRYTMNNFIISVGAYVVPLNKEAIATAKKIGTVTVDMNGTACIVPSAVEYIAKIEARGSLGKKKKTVKC
jgi:3-methyladenine DNA glycosylase AlkD